MTTPVEEKLPEESLIKVEVADELKDTCWLEERIFESQIRSLKENQNWDVCERSFRREAVGKYLTKIDSNLGDCGLFLIYNRSCYLKLSKPSNSWKRCRT